MLCIPVHTQQITGIREAHVVQEAHTSEVLRQAVRSPWTVTRDPNSERRILKMLGFRPPSCHGSSVSEGWSITKSEWLVPTHLQTRARARQQDTQESTSSSLFGMIFTCQKVSKLPSDAAAT